MARTMDPIRLVSEALECEPDSLSDGSGLARHPKWDSLGHVSIMVALEEHYGIQINNDTIRRFESMEEIIRRFDEIDTANTDVEEAIELSG